MRGNEENVATVIDEMTVMREACAEKYLLKLKEVLGKKDFILEYYDEVNEITRILTISFKFRKSVMSIIVNQFEKELTTKMHFSLNGNMKIIYSEMDVKERSKRYLKKLQYRLKSEIVNPILEKLVGVDEEVIVMANSMFVGAGDADVIELPNEIYDSIANYRDDAITGLPKDYKTPD